MPNLSLRSSSKTDLHEVELVTIYEISKLLSSSLDLHKTIHEVLNLLSSHLHMRRSMVSLVQDDELRVVAAAGLSEEEIGRGRFLLGEGITGRILQTGVPAVVPDISKEPLFLNRTGSRKLEEGEAVAFIGVPIKVGRESIGVLSVDREGCLSKRCAFERDVRFLSMVSNLIGQTVLLHHSVAIERQQLMQEKFRLQKELQDKYSLENVIGHSKRMQEVFSDVHQAAPGKATILLRGESGTGKEVIARAIHYQSGRRDGPFVKLNCAALPESLLESELFGHEKGAFTGATHERKGRFELANGGTLFLDEIGDVSPAFQAKLLRVLQEREMERVGGRRPIPLDVRVVATSNRDMQGEVAKGAFREDLYYRLNVIELRLPALRERPADIVPLDRHFVSRLAVGVGRHGLSLSGAAERRLTHYSWPGNIRELENVIQRAMILAPGEGVDTAHLLLPQQGGENLPAAKSAAPGGSEGETLDMRSLERAHIMETLEAVNGARKLAAQRLGISERTLRYKLQQYREEAEGGTAGQ